MFVDSTIAEAIGLIASVLASIDLACQLAQGCHYVCACLDNIRDAPEHLRSLLSEIKLSESTIEIFCQVFIDLNTRIPTRHADQIRRALEHSEEAVFKLRKLVAKTENPLTKWCQTRVALGKDEYANHLVRVGNSKEYILTTQAKIVL
jgi:hypothetical protein